MSSIPNSRECGGIMCQHVNPERDAKLKGMKESSSGTRKKELLKRLSQISQ